MIKSFIPRLAEIGKIKIGGKGVEKTSAKGTKYRVPIKYNHFVITKNEKNSANNFIINDSIMKLVGSNSTELPVILLFDDIEKNLLTSFECYHGHKCVCRGDGETAKRIQKDGKEINVSCPCDLLNDAKKTCKPGAILSVLLPQANEIGGVFKFRTHSWNSVQNLMGSLAFIKSQTGGKLAGIPLILHIVPKSTEGHGNVLTVNIKFKGGTKQLEQAVITETKRREEFKIDMKQIESAVEKSGVLLDNDDPADVDDEFYQSTSTNEVDSKIEAIDANAFTESPIIFEEEKKPVEKVASDDKNLSKLL